MVTRKMVRNLPYFYPKRHKFYNLRAENGSIKRFDLGTWDCVSRVFHLQSVKADEFYNWQGDSPNASVTRSVIMKSAGNKNPSKYSRCNYRIGAISGE